MFAFTLLVQKRVSDAQKRVDNAGLFDHIWRPHPFDPAGEEALAFGEGACLPPIMIS